MCERVKNAGGREKSKKGVIYVTIGREKAKLFEMNKN